VLWVVVACALRARGHSCAVASCEASLQAPPRSSNRPPHMPCQSCAVAFPAERVLADVSPGRMAQFFPEVTAAWQAASVNGKLPSCSLAPTRQTCHRPVPSPWPWGRLRPPLLTCALLHPHGQATKFPRKRSRRRAASSSLSLVRAHLKYCTRERRACLARRKHARCHISVIAQSRAGRIALFCCVCARRPAIIKWRVASRRQARDGVHAGQSRYQWQPRKDQEVPGEEPRRDNPQGCPG
jgi:hypothetical protein